MISTAGYIHDTGCLQVRQRPPSATQLRTGRLSNQLSIRPHDVQREPRMHDGLAERKPIRADVEEAADAQAEQRDCE